VSRPKVSGGKDRFLQIRMSEEEKEMATRLGAIYGRDMSTLIRDMLYFFDAMRPALVIDPKG
jgi:hypothetical protein